MSSPFALFLALAAWVSLVAGSLDVVPHSKPRADHLSRRYIAHALSDARIRKRDEEFKNSTSLDDVFNDVTLFKLSGSGGNGKTGAEAGISIVCTACYTKGQATASLTVDDEFNATQVFDTVEDTVSDTLDQIVDWVDSIDFNATDGELHLPAPNVTLDVDVPDFPAYTLEFQFDGLELYTELETTLSGGLSYSLNLFRSTGLGIELTDDLFLGIIFGIDLILSVDGELVINSGFHIKLDDGVLLRLALFAEEASDMNFNGGQFEFLPVTVTSAGTTFKALLQLSLRAGFSYKTPDVTPGFEVDVLGFNPDDYRASAGVEGRIYANVAEFVTNITANTDNDDADCDVSVVQEYQFAVGAAAGATVGLGDHIWGPHASVETPIYITTLTQVCASSAPASVPATATATVEARAPQDGGDLTTTTLTKTRTYAATQCASSGLLNCPASLQSLKENVAEETRVTSVASGVTATWPEVTTTKAAAAVSTVEFGDNVQKMFATSGKPEPYDPKKHGGEGGGGDGGGSDGKTGGVDNDVIIGVSVGIGAPVIIGIIAGIVFCRRRRSRVQYSPATSSPTTYEEASYIGHHGGKQGSPGFSPVG